MAQKYGISEKNIHVETNYTALNECGAITSDETKNIHDPESMFLITKKPKSLPLRVPEGSPQTRKGTLDQKHIFDNNQTQLGLSRSEPGVSLQ